jgi:hypothetical protein
VDTPAKAAEAELALAGPLSSTSDLTGDVVASIDLERATVPDSRAARVDRRSTEPVFTEPQRLHKVLAQCGYGSLRGLEELIIAGRITVNRQPAEVGQKVGPNDQVRINGELVRLRFAAPRVRVLLYHKPAGEDRQPLPTRRDGRRCSTSCAIGRRQVDRGRAPRFQQRGAC